MQNKVILNAYPDSLGGKLSEAIKVLQKAEFQEVFSIFYLLPTFFNSDLDRGFSIIDYGLNKELVSSKDLAALEELGIELKLDIVLNHLSVASPQFQDMIAKGDDSKFKDFFINWNEFWAGKGELNDEGIIIPEKKYLDKLFMRKANLPILKVLFPDGSERPYWNTFYQKVSYEKLAVEDLPNLDEKEAKAICEKVNLAIENGENPTKLPFDDKILKVINQKRSYLGQMDVNAKSPLVWEFYEDVLAKLREYGCHVLRLDAFAYLHKEVGETNFFNTPGTWEYLAKINEIARKNNLQLLPEIHSEYGSFLHDEVAQKGYLIYDFFLPGLLIHTLEKHTNKALLQWANEIIEKGYKTVNMLGCHDGIPLLDLKGKNGNRGLLTDEEIEDIMDLVLERGGKVKNLYGTDGKKISYYQVNATFFSALGEDERKFLLARAIQLFMVGTPQIWYLDLFARTNDYDAVARAGEGGHKEINRTNLSTAEIEKDLQKNIVLQQLELIKLRNTHEAFAGSVRFENSAENQLKIQWKNGKKFAILEANLDDYSFKLSTSEGEKRY